MPTTHLNLVVNEADGISVNRLVSWDAKEPLTMQKLKKLLNVSKAESILEILIDDSYKPFTDEHLAILADMAQLRCFVESERSAFDDVLKKQKEDVQKREEELKEKQRRFAELRDKPSEKDVKSKVERTESPTPSDGVKEEKKDEKKDEPTTTVKSEEKEKEKEKEGDEEKEKPQDP